MLSLLRHCSLLWMNSQMSQLDKYITKHDPPKSQTERELEDWYNAANDDIDEMQIERCDG